MPTAPHLNDASQDALQSVDSEDANSASDLMRNSPEGEFEIGPNEDLEIHLAAKMFPLRPDDVEKMVASFRVSSQMDPVIVHEEKILDGRTRNEARKQLGWPLKCWRLADLGGLKPLEWVVRRNMASGTTRQLSDSQRALIGAELCIKVFEPQADKRRRGGVALSEDEKGTASEKAAEAVNVSNSRLRDARIVLDARCEDLKDAVWNGEISISNAAQIGRIEDKKVLKQAISAARARDRAALRKALGQETSIKDSLGNEISPELQEIFQAADTQKPHLASLRRLSRWLKDSITLPEGRLLTVNIPPETFDLLIEKIERSRPWCVCPFCDKSSTAHCQLCAGSRWLTESEYSQAMDSAKKLLVASNTQDSTPQRSREDVQ